MALLEELKPGSIIKGLSSDGTAKVVNVEWFGSQAIKVVYEDSTGRPKDKLVYRSDEPVLEVVKKGLPWSFDGDGSLFRLVSEAYRIKLAYLFDHYLAIHTSLVEPLPHQITAVYENMLSRQPLRFLLADDPGAGKTIMAGLLIKELFIRGDVERCLIVAPGNLVEQWQDELYEKFGLRFDILTKEKIEASLDNPFQDSGFLIARLDMLSRNEPLQAKFRSSKDWDLIICDEAHKMSATCFSGEINFTKRYQLGRTLGEKCRHFLLMTATPHNGKEEDFQLFMALIDSDRFEGKFRDGVHKTDVSDLMRRMVKEELVKFDGKPLFPERKAYTLNYKLSDEEAALYAEVTNYVREEMNRVERFSDENPTQRVNVGFAMQSLQRRLASSPEAIYQSLLRRRERLERRLNEEVLLQRGEQVLSSEQDEQDEVDITDLEDAPEAEVDQVEETILDRATASRNVEELIIEIETLKNLEERARKLRNSGKDTKWLQLNSILDDPLMIDKSGNRRKLVIFTESKDTLKYLESKIKNRLGNNEAVIAIHGGLLREERKKLIEGFTHDKNVLILVATDAVGEGVNLQRAHLMVNYDLPWNPNRLEQRFGRIHRIGQTEVCHLWNLVASETREGEVYNLLLKKLEKARESLGGKVYNVLGRLFDEYPLRDLLIQAIRYGDDPTVKAKLEQIIENAVNSDKLVELLEEKALVKNTLDKTKVQEIREEMERAQARRLQPHFIQSFFLKAFEHLGGKCYPREEDRFEITYVPGSIKERDRLIGIGNPIQSRYERICFEKNKIKEPPLAAFICPGHPLLDCTIDLILERYRDLLKKGTVLIDENDDGEESRVLFYLEQVIQDGRTNKHGIHQVVSQKFQFTEIDQNGKLNSAGAAPYLDYTPIKDNELEILKSEIETNWLNKDLEAQIISYAIANLVPEHLEEVKNRRLKEIEKVETEVTSRLKREINFWDHRAEELKIQERAGRNTKLSSSNAATRAQELEERLQRRLKELEREREISALPPQIRGGAIIIPKGLLKKLNGENGISSDVLTFEEREKIEKAAMQAVISIEKSIGRMPTDVSKQRGIGYDIESKDPKTGSLYFIEVKGRWHTKDEVTLTKNEILCSRNEPEKFRLALVTIDETGPKILKYVKGFSFGEPDFAETTRTFNLSKLLELAGDPL